MTLYTFRAVDGMVTLAVSGRERLLDAMESTIFRANMAFTGRNIPDRGMMAGYIKQEKEVRIASRFLLPSVGGA
jgi:hypothetical protein